jgi:hypothetical protein
MRREQFNPEKVIGLLRQVESSWLKASGSARSAECWASPNRVNSAGAACTAA